MATFAEFKRQFKIGTRFMVDHDTAPDRCNGIRVVVKVQTNAIVSRFADANDPRNAQFGGLGSWCDWGKASDWNIISATSAHNGQEGCTGFTYTILED